MAQAEGELAKVDIPEGGIVNLMLSVFFIHFLDEVFGRLDLCLGVKHFDKQLFEEELEVTLGAVGSSDE